MKKQNSKINFLKIQQNAKRPLASLGVALIVFSAMPLTAFAAIGGGQVQQRSIRMSDNAASNGTIAPGTLGSGQNVTYRVKFRAASSYTVRGIVLDFCSGEPTPAVGTPFIGDSNCDLPTGFNIPSSPTIDTNDYMVDPPTVDTPGIGATGWTAASANNQTVKLSNTTGTALTSGNDYTFSVAGITNPSYKGTFYARLITYTTDAGDFASYAHGTVGSYQDYGGFALATTNIVEVTAKVQETLTFCVSGTTGAAPTPPVDVTTLLPPADCTAATPAAIQLGHGTNVTLTPEAVDYNGIFTFASTNALNGLVIRMRNSNACGGLSTDLGTTCAIVPASAGAATPSIIEAGDAEFGMFCNNSATPSGAVFGIITCDPNYNSGVAGSSDPSVPEDLAFGMDYTSPGEHVSSLYGDRVASSTGPISNVVNRFDFAASASNVTPAGIYRANLAMIATGTF